MLRDEFIHHLLHVSRHALYRSRDDKAPHEARWCFHEDDLVRKAQPCALRRIARLDAVKRARLKLRPERYARRRYDALDCEASARDARAPLRFMGRIPCGENPAAIRDVRQVSHEDVVVVAVTTVRLPRSHL